MIKLLFAQLLLFVSLTSYAAPDTTPPPAYLAEFYQKVLNPYLPKHGKEKHENPYRIITEKVGSVHTIKLDVLIPQPQVKRSEWKVYSTYQFVFTESDLQRKEPASVKIHRSQDKKGNYFGPAIEGQLNINFNNGALVDPDSLTGLLRSLFRADITLHPLFKNPLLPEKDQVKKLTAPQNQALGMTQDSELPGLVKMYLEHKKSGAPHPMLSALVLPTGIGKSIVALKYLEMIKMIHQGQTPTMLFVVENKIILADMVQKLQELYPGAKIATLFGGGTKMEIPGGVDFILSTRSTFFKRQDEIIDVLSKKSGPKVIYRDEGHHTGKVGGQFAQLLVRLMNALGNDSQIVDLSATPWHEDAFDLIKQYQGKVGTSFVTKDEYEKLINGQQVDRIARLQLVRAILEGWLAPIEGLTFITRGDGAKEGVTFRRQLIQEQQEMLDRLGLDFSDKTLSKLSELDEEQISFLKQEIKDVHESIVKELYQDLKAQLLRDRSSKFAEYDRGIIFVPTIFHAEAYQMLLSEMTERGDNMEFRVVHSKQTRGKRVDVVEENIDWFNSDEKPHQHRYLISVDMLREGVDMPSVNRVVSATTSESIKVLLQMFGRGTRLSPLKSGIRLTDFGGSFLKFFQEIPGSLLQQLFPLYEDKGEDNSSYMSFHKEEKKAVLKYDGEGISPEQLQVIEVEDPMEELSTVGSRDERRLKGINSKKVKNQVARMSEVQDELGWSVVLETPDQENVNVWLSQLVNWRPYTGDAGKAYDSVYSVADNFDKDLYFKRMISKYGVRKGVYGDLGSDSEKLLREVLASLIDPIYAQSLAIQNMPIDSVIEALVQFSVEETKESERGNFLGKVFSKLSEKELMYLYVNTSDEDLERVTDAGWSKFPASRVKRVLIEREAARLQAFYDNREKMMSFVTSNWRWLSLPWQYLAEDILIEEEFYKNGHPFAPVLEYLSKAENREQLESQGFYRPIDAIEAAFYDFLPEEIAVSFEKALQDDDELLDHMVAVVNVYPLMHSKEGRAFLLDSPLAVNFVNQEKAQTYRKLAPFYYPEETNRYAFDRSELSENEQSGTWDFDYRWVLKDGKAEGMFTSVEFSEEIEQLRRKSLVVGEPFSGLSERGDFNLLRLAAMSKQMGVDSTKGILLSSQFAHASFLRNRGFGSFENNTVLDESVGSFSMSRFWKFIKKPAQYAYGDNAFQVKEHELYKQALIVEVEERNLGQVNIDKVENRVTKDVLIGEDAQPLLLSDLIEMIPSLDISTFSEDERIAMNSSLREVSYELTSYRWGARYGKRTLITALEGEAYKLDQTSIDKEYGDYRYNIWWDYLNRVIYNPSLSVLNPEDQLRVAELMEMIGGAFQTSEARIPEHWLNKSDWLLSEIPKSDLPFPIEGVSGVAGNGLFKGNRMFMVLPLYYVAKYSKNALSFEGVGKVNDQKLQDWLPHFEAKYGEELAAFDFEIMLPSDVVLEYAFQTTVNNKAQKKGVYRDAYRDMAKDLGSYSEDIVEEGKALIRNVGVGTFENIMKDGLNYEYFKAHMYTKIMEKVFSVRSHSHTINFWDLLVDHLTGIELERSAAKIKVQPGFVKTYEMTTEPRSLADRVVLSSEGSALTCKALLAN